MDEDRLQGGIDGEVAVAWWAGLELEAGGQSVVIDDALDAGIFSAFFGEPRAELASRASAFESLRTTDQGGIGC
jgi:hypothetical protein